MTTTCPLHEPVGSVGMIELHMKQNKQKYVKQNAYNIIFSTVNDKNL